MNFWTIYKHPKDYPDKYVVRRHAVHYECMWATDDFHVADTLEDVRAHVPKECLRIERCEADEPQIVEVWV